jgi:tRNA dimethylallyltransferase
MTASEAPLAHPLLGVVGPTASGKTDLAIALCRAASPTGEPIGEILCCDALQLRAGLPLLTAKPTPAQLAAAPHHLIGALPLSRPANAAAYVELAEAAIADIQRRGRRVVLCGGTGLYLRALRQGLFAGPAADPAFRAALRAERERLGTAALHARLRAVDPAAAARIAEADYVRIERALEVHALTGRPISAHQEEHRRTGPRRDVVLIGLDPGPEALRARIRQRITGLIEQGLCEEVAATLAPAQPPIEQPPLGYETVRRHLAGELSLAEMAEALAHEHAQYAKRQRTWFRREPGVTWARTAEEVDLAAWLAHPGGPPV